VTSILLQRRGGGAIIIMMIPGHQFEVPSAMSPRAGPVNSFKLPHACWRGAEGRWTRLTAEDSETPSHRDGRNASANPFESDRGLPVPFTVVPVPVPRCQ
jgi:hypothetical protein